MANPPHPPRTTSMSKERDKFAMIPHLVLESGLSVHAVRLYLEMKMTTGEKESGECCKSTETLATACRMAMGSVSNAKQQLLSKGFIKNLGKIKGRDSDTFQVVKIWSRNSEKRSPDESQRSPNESERSPGETNKNPMNKNPRIRTSHSASGVAGESELIQMGYEPDHAQILSLWNKKMTPLGWLPLNTYSTEVVNVFRIWS